MPTERMVPPPGASPPMRMTASWSGLTDPTAYKSVARSCTHGELPSDHQRRHRPDAETVQKAPSQFIIARVLRPQALRNTSVARRQAAKLCYRFDPLTPFRALREPDRRRRDEERLSRSEQRTAY